MANTGKFYPFNRYINDIALLMDGSHKIIPSKYILLKELVNSGTESSGSGEVNQGDQGGTHNGTTLTTGGNIIDPGLDLATWTWVDNVVDFVNQIYDNNSAQTLEDINYQSARKTILYFLLNKASKPNNYDEEYNLNYYIGGDINFISHDVYDGMLYSEIYLHVPNDAGQYRVRVNNTNQAQDLHVLTDLEPYQNGDTKTYSFQAALMFYNIYKTGSDEPFACDIPLGVFVLLDETGNNISSQELIIQSDELLGNGTAWSTRICSRFVSSAAINDDMAINTGQSDYSTLTSLLSEFGKSIKIMESNISSREEDMLTIKSYLDDFKHSQTVNVPYVLGDWWYVNGRPVRPVDELELVLAQGNQFSWTSTVDMTWPNDNEEQECTILNYINDKTGLSKFLLICAREEQNGRFEGTNGVVCVDIANKTLTVECKMESQAIKTFRTYDIEFVEGDTITYNGTTINIGKNG